MTQPGDTAAAQGVEVQTSWTAVRRSKVAFTIHELVELSSTFSKRRSDGSSRTSGCTSRVIRTDAKKFLFVYKVTCSEKDSKGRMISDPNGHTVRLKFDMKRVRATGRASDLDVRVSCSCPAFLYWGAQWNLSTGDALYGAPRPKFQPPTEPRRYQYVVCKHVQLVADRIDPAITRMLEAYLSPEEKAEEAEKLKQVEVVNQNTQLDVDRKEEEAEASETPAPEEKAPERRPITPKTQEPEPEDDLDAMPDDLTTLGLPPRPSDPTVRKPITPKAPPVVAPEPEPEPAPEPPPQKRKRPGPRPKNRPAPPPNVTVVDDEDDTTTILPGALARPKMREEEADDVEFFPAKEPETPGPLAQRRLAPKPGKPKNLPPNIKLIDDDTDDEVIKINRLKRAMLLSALALAGTEA